MLRQRVAMTSARLKSLEADYLLQMQENLGLRSDMLASRDDDSQRCAGLSTTAAAPDADARTRSRPYLEQSQKLQATETELRDAQRLFRDPSKLENAELRSGRAARASSAAGAGARTPDVDARADAADTTSSTTDQDAAAPPAAQAELDRVLALAQRQERRNEALDARVDQTQRLLRAALLDGDGDGGLPPDLRQLRAAEAVQRIRARVAAAAAAPPRRPRCRPRRHGRQPRRRCCRRPWRPRCRQEE